MTLALDGQPVWLSGGTFESRLQELTALLNERLPQAPDAPWTMADAVRVALDVGLDERLRQLREAK